MPNCRFCETRLEHLFVDLGLSPLCQTHIAPDQLNCAEPFYPLKAFVCGTCFLVQLDEYVSPDEIFSEYAYFSSFSDSWLAHAKAYTEKMIDLLDLDKTSRVMEIASNDGYLLQYFVAAGIPVLGIEPAANVAQAAIDKGVETEVAFLGESTARAIAGKYGQADLVLGNNVLAHVPKLNDFVRGLRTLLNADGVLTMEFPHLLRLMERNQYDTIYHEHFSYLSFSTVERVFARHDIVLFDVEELDTHGGSIRIFGRHGANEARGVTDRVREMREREASLGFNDLGTYSRFTEQVKKNKRDLLRFLIEARDQGKSVVGYGAPGKGNTLLNYCGIRTDFLDYTVDRNPYKQGKYTPGTRIPIEKPERIAETRPDYVLILPWNLRNEISGQLAFIRDWGGRFVVPIPELEVF